MSPRSFFGVQVAVRLDPDHPARYALVAAMEDLRGATGIAAQRPILHRLAGTFRQLGPHLWRGDWDLLTRDGEAHWRTWTGGVEAMAQWPEAEFGRDGDLLLLTLCALVEQGTNAARMLGDACDLDEGDWFRRRTFLRLLATPPLLNPDGLRRLALYAAPHPSRRGFSAAVLGGEGFAYLKPLG